MLRSFTPQVTPNYQEFLQNRRKSMLLDRTEKVYYIYYLKVLKGKTKFLFYREKSFKMMRTILFRKVAERVLKYS